MDEDIPKPEIVGLHKLLVISKKDEPAPNVRIGTSRMINKNSYNIDILAGKGPI